MQILIADDEKEMREILKAYFEKEGYSVTLAEDGCKTVEMLLEKSFDLIILDWMMPYQNGIDICRVYRDSTEAKILLLTAKTSPDDELAALTAGADDYLRNDTYQAAADR